jgi:diguanylate cyclase (GGDEF)-like protein
MGTILLVDDDARFQSVIAPALESRGHHVIHARTAAAATALVSAHAPDLVVVDGILPDNDGARWIRELREVGDHRRVIFVSSLWRDSASLSLLTNGLGVSLVVHKPLVPAIFIEQLEGQLALGGIPVRLDFDRAMEELRAEYAHAMHGKLADLAGALTRCRERPSDPTLRVEARAKAHNLRGTAGSYGFGDVALAVANIEDALSSKPKPPSLRWEDVDTWMEEARAAAERLAEELPDVPTRIGGTRILLVDGDAEFRRNATELGRRQLVEVVAVAEPAVALQEAQRKPVHAAIIDARLSHTPQSFELARELRALPGCKDLPLAFLSVDTRLESRVAAAHAGASLFLEKPLDSDAFADAVRELVAMGQTGQVRVMIVDDDEHFAAHIAAVLSRENILVSVLRGPEEILGALEEKRPDLLLLDVVMPGLGGFDVCRMLRTIPRWQDLPILFLTAKAEVESRVAAFQAGGDDYLTKPVVTEELLARIKVRLDRARLLRDRGSKDAVTGLFLRRTFLEGFASRMAECRRHARPLTLCLLDLDNLKGVNDAKGHFTGDRVLATLGELLSRRFRSEDLRGRWGGDEFIVAFGGETAETINGVMSRLLSEFSQVSFQGEDGIPFTATFSAGVASYPGDGETVEALLKAADRRLYLAKAAGRERVVHID